MKKILVIDNLYFQSTEFEKQLPSLSKIVNDSSIQFQTLQLNGINIDDSINNIVRRYEEEHFDCVLIDLSASQLTSDDYKHLLSIMEYGICLIVVTNAAVENNSQYIAAIQECNKRRGQLCCIDISRIKYLSQYIYGLGYKEENFLAADYGFLYREEESIQQREYILEKFNNSAKEILNSKRIEIPIIAPVYNFLTSGADEPRPLQAKDSNKLFAAVANDGNALSVRYEGTALVARLVAENFKRHNASSYNYHYFQEMVRMEFKKDLDKNHYRAFYQAGVELFTTNKEAHLNNICNMIVFLRHFIHSLNQDLWLISRFSHINILKPLDMYLNKADDRFAKNKLIHIMEKGSEEELIELLKPLRVDNKRDAFLLKLKKIQQQKLSVAEGVDILQNFPEYKELNIDISELVQIKDNPQLADCIFDPGIHRSLNFYSGITLQGDLDYRGISQKEFLGGGSFTGMVESFGYYGCPVFSFGVAIGVERLMNILK